MFDKIYRQAMDDVPLNTALLADLKKQAKQIDEQKISKKAKKPVFNVYRYGFAAAAIVAVVLGANVFSSYMEAKNSVFTTENSNTQAADTVIENDIGIQPEQSTSDTLNNTYTANVPETNTKADNTPSNKQQAKQQPLTGDNTTEKTDVSEEINPEISQHSEIVADAATPASEEPAEIVADSLQPSENAVAVLSDTGEETAVFGIEAETASATDIVVQEAASELKIAEETITATTEGSEEQAASGGGGSGGDMSARLAAAPETLRESWSIDEFCSWFEIDILSFTLPAEMQNTVSGNAYVEKDETGSILGGQCSVYYAADGKSVAMTIYSDSDYVNAVAVGEQTSFGASVVRYENGAFTVYAYPGDRGCVAEIFGFSEEELTAFVNSLR